MNDMWVTVCGNVGTTPLTTTTARGTKTTFRVAHTPRVRAGDEWQDGDTSWYSVVAWNALGDNASASLHKGQRVLVHGRVRVNEWQDDQGRPRQTTEITAEALGHDLRFGITKYGRPQWQTGAGTVPGQPGPQAPEWGDPQVPAGADDDPWALPPGADADPFADDPDDDPAADADEEAVGLAVVR